MGSSGRVVPKGRTGRRFLPALSSPLLISVEEQDPRHSKPGYMTTFDSGSSAGVSSRAVSSD